MLGEKEPNAVDNMPDRYADKDFVISTSLSEWFHHSIAEGMASGLRPLIHDRYGAREICPHEFLFIVEGHNQADKYEQIVNLLASETENSPAVPSTLKEAVEKLGTQRKTATFIYPLSFPRKRESRKINGLLDARFHGHDESEPFRGMMKDFFNSP